MINIAEPTIRSFARGDLNENSTLGDYFSYKRVEVNHDTSHWIEDQVRLMFGDRGKFIGAGGLQLVDAVITQESEDFAPASLYFQYRDRFIHLEIGNMLISQSDVEDPDMPIVVKMDFMGEQAFLKEKAKRDAAMSGDKYVSDPFTEQKVDSEWAFEELNSPESFPFGRVMLGLLGEARPNMFIMMTPSDRKRHTAYTRLASKVDPMRERRAQDMGMPFIPLQIDDPVEERRAA